MALDENPGRVYALSFIPARKDGRGKSTPPGIAFSVSVRIHERVLLYASSERGTEMTNEISEKYLGKRSEFVLTAGKIGFKSCFEVELNDGNVTYRLWLRSKLDVPACVLTIQFLLFVFDALIANDEEKESNRKQFLEVSTRCSNEGFYAHAVSGRVYPIFARYLHGHAQQSSDGMLPASVTNAMRSVWRAVGIASARKYADDCYGRIRETGEFSLICFGDACDVSIYPDQSVPLDAGYSVGFSCHNLDHASQQLTLLAGLAALHDLAVSELEQNT